MEIKGYPTDKDVSGYLPTYQGLARTMRRDPAICEIGVYQGGSLALWQELFPVAAVVAGVDINPESHWPPGTVKIVMQQDDPLLAAELVKVLANEAGPGHMKWDMIIDDASHHGHPTLKTFMHLWPLVAPGGYYVIEDWCVGFEIYPNYDDSMLNLAMMLLNQFDHPENDTHFITYQYGMIVLRKKEL